MLNRYRRDAAVLAAYLAQFDTADPDPPNTHSGTATSFSDDDVDRARLRRDYAQACYWSTATDFTDDDIDALAHMRLAYGFTATG
ncbi:hypothetical protein [Rhodococcus erythropolis]|uniref:hypothetical protein n=1 Tax=Rhodococcus erythropolis TaxID=1833 RepID=UPI001BE74427|nr:hypothetical protein [Rhodococcus erythropolis]MBT2266004.1 hypothetical protein [Rhodococcus erythropolis]